MRKTPYSKSLESRLEEMRAEFEEMCNKYDDCVRASSADRRDHVYLRDELSALRHDNKRLRKLLERMEG